MGLRQASLTAGGQLRPGAAGKAWLLTGLMLHHTLPVWANGGGLGLASGNKENKYRSNCSAEVEWRGMAGGGIRAFCRVGCQAHKICSGAAGGTKAHLVK